jgi:hypothetical protein
MQRNPVEPLFFGSSFSAPVHHRIEYKIWLLNNETDVDVGIPGGHTVSIFGA